MFAKPAVLLLALVAFVSAAPGGLDAASPQGVAARGMSHLFSTFPLPHVSYSRPPTATHQRPGSGLPVAPDTAPEMAVGEALR